MHASTLRLVSGKFNITALGPFFISPYICQSMIIEGHAESLPYRRRSENGQLLSARRDLASVNRAINIKYGPKK